VEGHGTASGPGRHADAASVVAMVAAAASVPGRLPADDSGGSQAPDQQLRAIAESLTRAGNRSASAGSKYEPRGRALVFRPWPARSLHVVGDSPLAAGFRRLLTAGEVPGWDLHPVPAGRTPLNVLAGPLHRLSGSVRFYGLGGAPAETGSLRAPGDPGRDPGGPAGNGELPAEVAAALQVVAAWAVAVHGAQVLGDLLGELEERRRLILTSRTFAPDRRTYDSLAAKLGVSRGCVSQLEASAPQQLAYAAAHDRYRPLRWRAASAAQTGSSRVVPIPGAPPWMDRMLTWLASKTNAADG
jgi:Sigma-70, region 4